jgi:hypothetical protein
VVALQDLQVALEASTATWKIVIGHHMILSVGSPDIASFYVASLF